MPTFQCQHCSACCRQPGFVYLKEEDVERLAAYLEMDIYQFTGTHCLLMDRQHLALKKNPDETCLFLEPTGCTVYAARPTQCRDFPLNWKTEGSQHYCKGMKKV